MSETDEMFSEEISKEELEFESKAKAERMQAMKKALEAGKPFKDLLLGREKEWKEVKGLISTHVYDILMVGNEIITRDFLAGIKHCVELIDTRIKECDSAFEALGKE